MTRLSGSYANRGSALEAMINATNDSYNARGIAVVHKRPTPVHIGRTRGAQIVEAWIESKSTVDYEGVYRGHSLQFEAKQTRETSRFPLSNFHAHQVDHMRACMMQGAIVFAVIEFTEDDERLFVPGSLIVDAWDGRKRLTGRASLARDELQRTCNRIAPTRGVPVDYLAVVDKLIAARQEVIT